MAYEQDRSNFEYSSAYAETIYGVNFLLNRDSWNQARRVWETCLEWELPLNQKDHVHTQLVRMGSYLKNPLFAMEHYSKITNQDQRSLASHILRKAFPESFSAAQRM
jgi:hypothetical protein